MYNIRMYNVKLGIWSFCSLRLLSTRLTGLFKGGVHREVGFSTTPGRSGLPLLARGIVQLAFSVGYHFVGWSLDKELL